MNPDEILDLQFNIIKDGIAKAEELTEGKDDEKDERVFETAREEEAERDFFPEPEIYGEGEQGGSDDWRN